MESKGTIVTNTTTIIETLRAAKVLLENGVQPHPQGPIWAQINQAIEDVKQIEQLKASVHVSTFAEQQTLLLDLLARSRSTGADGLLPSQAAEQDEPTLLEALQRRAAAIECRIEEGAEPNEDFVPWLRDQYALVCVETDVALVTGVNLEIIEAQIAQIEGEPELPECSPEQQKAADAAYSKLKRAIAAAFVLGTFPLYQESGS